MKAFQNDGACRWQGDGMTGWQNERMTGWQHYVMRACKDDMIWWQDKSLHTCPCLIICSVTSAPISSSISLILMLRNLPTNQSSSAVLASPQVVKQTAARVWTPSKYHPPPETSRKLSNRKEESTHIQRMHTTARLKDFTIMSTHLFCQMHVRWKGVNYL